MCERIERKIRYQTATVDESERSTACDLGTVQRACRSWRRDNMPTAIVRQMVLISGAGFEATDSEGDRVVRRFCQLRDAARRDPSSICKLVAGFFGNAIGESIMDVQRPVLVIWFSDQDSSIVM